MIEIYKYFFKNSTLGFPYNYSNKFPLAKAASKILFFDRNKGVGT